MPFATNTSQNTKCVFAFFFWNQSQFGLGLSYILNPELVLNSSGTSKQNHLKINIKEKWTSSSTAVRANSGEPDNFKGSAKLQSATRLSTLTEQVSESFIVLWQQNVEE